MKLTCCTIWLLLQLAALPLSAVTGAPPLSSKRAVQPLSNVPQLVLPPTDIQAELAADRKLGRGGPLRFAVAHPVQITPATDGLWEQLPEGRLWRIRIISSGATDLNLGFTRFWLPEGATLHVLAGSEPYFQGPFTARDNQAYHQLWTPVVPGESMVVELFVPAEAQAEPKLSLTQVSTGYRDLFHTLGGSGLAKAETCEIDVACPQAAPWTNEIRSVARISIGGNVLCTATLLMDAAGDFRNFLLTANHCGINSANAATVVAYWNYQSPTCGQHGLGGSLAQNTSGAVFRAAKYDVDFCLIELSSTPDPSYGVYYAGWDRSGVAPTGCVGIHHPNADGKCISFSSNLLTRVDSCIGTGGGNTHWQVVWSSGVTEPGSSGSGIWTPDTRSLIGTLSGGGSDCASPLAPDCYGNFAVAWSSGSSGLDRLRDWLDPLNSGVSNVPGADPARLSIITAAGTTLVAESCSPTNQAIDPGETVAVDFTLRNDGGVNTTNLVATLLPAGGIIYPGTAQNFGALSGHGPSQTRTFTFTAMGNCGSVVTPTFQLIDGSRNLGRVQFSLPLGLAFVTNISSQNFDALTAPALPAGWSSSSIGGGTPWQTSTVQSDTPPNAAFAPDADFVNDNILTSPPMTITATNAQLTFQHSFDLEGGFDGGVLEFSLNAGAFSDILSAGGSFVTGGYNSVLSTDYHNPLGGRAAWSGNSSGFLTTTINLPPIPVGQPIQLRWRLGTDNSTGLTGWYVDTISLSQKVYSCCTSVIPPLILNPRPASSGSFAFSYDSVAGQTYFVETTTYLNPPAWSVLQTNLGDGSRQSFTNSTSGLIRRYFRLRTQ